MTEKRDREAAVRALRVCDGRTGCECEDVEARARFVAGDTGTDYDSEWTRVAQAIAQARAEGYARGGGQMTPIVLTKAGSTEVVAYACGVCGIVAGSVMAHGDADARHRAEYARRASLTTESPDAD